MITGSARVAKAQGGGPDGDIGGCLFGMVDAQGGAVPQGYARKARPALEHAVRPPLEEQGHVVPPAQAERTAGGAAR